MGVGTWQGSPDVAPSHTLCSVTEHRRGANTNGTLEYHHIAVRVSYRAGIPPPPPPPARVPPQDIENHDVIIALKQGIMAASCQKPTRFDLREVNFSGGHPLEGCASHTTCFTWVDLAVYVSWQSSNTLAAIWGCYGSFFIAVITKGTPVQFL